MEVIDGNIRRTFEAQTNMKWLDFYKEAHKRFSKPHSEVELGYRIGDKTGAVSYLGCESEWDKALCQLREKVQAARTRPVSMDIKNIVSYTALNDNRTYTYIDCL